MDMTGRRGLTERGLVSEVSKGYGGDMEGCEEGHGEGGVTGWG